MSDLLKFCEKCDNLYNFKTEDNKLMFECMQCHHTEVAKQTCLSYNIMDSNQRQYPINSDIVYDPTLARTRTQKCLNTDCPSNKAEKYVAPEVVYFNANINLKLMYMCTECKHHWEA